MTQRIRRWYVILWNANAERHLRRVFRTPNEPLCRCGCYGCRHHCGAHWPWWQRAIEKTRDLRPARDLQR